MRAVRHEGPRTQAGLEWPAPVIVLEALSRFVSPATIRSVLTQTGRRTQRIRRLPTTTIVWLVIAIGLWTDLDVPAIWRQIVGTLRSLVLSLDARHPPCKSVLSQARTRLRACRATPNTVPEATRSLRVVRDPSQRLGVVAIPT